MPSVRLLTGRILPERDGFSGGHSLLEASNVRKVVTAASSASAQSEIAPQVVSNGL